MPTVPTRNEEFVKLIEHLRKAQEACIMLCHLVKAEGSKEDIVLGNAWLTVSEQLKQMQGVITKMATRGLQ